MSNLILPSNQPILQVGGRVFTDLAGLIILYASAASGTGAGATFRKTGAAGYAVTAGKTLKIYAIRISNGATAINSIQFGYADNDIGQESASLYTNPVYLGCGATGYLLCWGGQGPGDFATDLAIPAGKYPMVNCAGGPSRSSIQLFGYEV